MNVKIGYLKRTKKSSFARRAFFFYKIRQKIQKKIVNGRKSACVRLGFVVK
jgi:hypothetical protein